MVRPTSSKRKQRLMSLSWPEYAEIADSGPILVLPTGAIEQHGPHLPLTTDTVIATALSEKVANELPNVFAAAPIGHGTRSDLYSGGGERFPGTVSLRPETYLALASDVLSELANDGTRRFLILNGHYENAPLLREATRRLCATYPGSSVMLCNWWDIPPRDAIEALYPEGTFPGMELEHGGLLETSLMLYLHPELVGDPKTFPSHLCTPPGYEVYPEAPPNTSDSGALAPATHASAEIGGQLCRLVIGGIVVAVRDTFGET